MSWKLVVFKSFQWLIYITNYFQEGKDKSKGEQEKQWFKFIDLFRANKVAVERVKEALDDMIDDNLI